MRWTLLVIKLPDVIFKELWSWMTKNTAKGVWSVSRLDSQAGLEDLV